MWWIVDIMKQLWVGFLGGGLWGIMVVLLVVCNVLVLLWVCDMVIVVEINGWYMNEKYLFGVCLNDGLQVIIDISEVIVGADVIVVGVLLQYFCSIFELVCEYIWLWVFIISFVKGLEVGIGLCMMEIIVEVLFGYLVGVLMGLNFVCEIMVGLVVVSVIVMEDQMINCLLQCFFSSGLFCVYINDDVIGCELGGVLKNVIVIVVGMGDG